MGVKPGQSRIQKNTGKKQKRYVSGMLVATY